MIPWSNIYLPPDYKHLADGAVCTTAAEKHTQALFESCTHSGNITHIWQHDPVRFRPGDGRREKQKERKGVRPDSNRKREVGVEG